MFASVAPASCRSPSTCTGAALPNRDRLWLHPPEPRQRTGDPGCWGESVDHGRWRSWMR